VALVLLGGAAEANRGRHGECGQRGIGGGAQRWMGVAEVVGMTALAGVTVAVDIAVQMQRRSLRVAVVAQTVRRHLGRHHRAIEQQQQRQQAAAQQSEAAGHRRAIAVKGERGW
jgi:fructose-specific phosphotransferase system component IIB